MPTLDTSSLFQKHTVWIRVLEESTRLIELADASGYWYPRSKAEADRAAAEADRAEAAADGTAAGMATIAYVDAAVADKVSSTTIEALERVTELPANPDPTTLYFVVPEGV